MIRVTNIKTSLDDRGKVEKPLYRKLGIAPQELVEYRVVKESIDARKGQICFTYTIDAELKQEQLWLTRNHDADIVMSPAMTYAYPEHGDGQLLYPPVVVGSGPAGLFAALLLAEMGYRPLMLERGAEVDARSSIVQRFWESGELDTETNVQFGEGGAGTFSDGKLTTLIRDVRIRKVLDEFVLGGAPREILYAAKPHVGTDILKRVVKAMRQRIVALGGGVRFLSKVTDILVENGRLTGLRINHDELIKTDAVVLALGHSARDTFAMLHDQGLKMFAKPFSIGLRVEHRQQWIDQAQYKQYAGHPNLGAADYKLAYHSPSGRSAYTFCMCPGGLVVAAASEPGCVVTNGMSEHARDAANANSALLVGVDPNDFASEHPLAGIEFQRRWERAAFDLGGGGFAAPAQRVSDFLQKRPSTDLGVVQPSYRPAPVLRELDRALPSYVVDTLREALLDFDRKLKGFAHPDAILTGIETRSSSPLRMERNTDCEASIGGIFPAGEGAGYAGGIVSAAVDGLRVAEAMVRRYHPVQANVL